MWFSLPLAAAAFVGVAAAMSPPTPDPGLSVSIGEIPILKSPFDDLDSSSGSYWLGKIKHRGRAPFSNNPSSYKVYRNVKEYGAKGDGVTDDTKAINRAIREGDRCGFPEGCNSTSTTPALVYFPPGKYLVSSPIIAYYYTTMVGDANDHPTLLASTNFNGSAVIDADPYTTAGQNWYINQSNFYRAVRNFIIDLRRIPPSNPGVGIHWQVAQATSLYKIRVEASTEPGNNHVGLNMENGSGGFMSDLTFNGGKYGMSVGSQQFTVRNLKVSNAQAAVTNGFAWAWTYQGVEIRNCQIGFNFTSIEGSNTIIDAKIWDTKVFVQTAGTQRTSLAGALVLENIDLSRTPVAVADVNGTLVHGSPVSTRIEQYVQGNAYYGTSRNGTYLQKDVVPPRKPDSLLDSEGNIFGRSRPQYQHASVDDIVSVKAHGAKGDGHTDDTAVLQRVLNENCDKIVYFDAGVYRVTSTLTIPTGSRIVGEVWSVILAKGEAFNDINNPTVVVKVGEKGDVGSVELSDLIFSTHAGSAGAIVLEINTQQEEQGSVGIWDCHFRIGGAKGLGLDIATCPAGQGTAKCISSFLSMHITKEASAYLENVWVWVADHDLDDPASRQIDVFAGRGVLSESEDGPVWFIGTASEHHALYQYNIVNSKNIYIGVAQTETAYWQPNPGPNTYFAPAQKYHDPPAYPAGVSALAFILKRSSDVFVYGAGFYNFFISYVQGCVNTNTCQQQIVDLEGRNKNTWIYNLNTVGSQYMISVDGQGVVAAADNKDGFTAVATVFTLGHANKDKDKDGHANTRRSKARLHY